MKRSAPHLIRNIALVLTAGLTANCGDVGGSKPGSSQPTTPATNAKSNDAQGTASETSAETAGDPDGTAAQAAAAGTASGAAAGTAGSAGTSGSAASGKAAAGTAASALTTTGGSGGKTGSFEGTFGTSGKYKIVVPSDIGAQKAYGLLVFLHGSQASSYATFAAANAPVAAANGLMSVSVLAPNGAGWNETNGATTAKYLDDFIRQTLYKQYNIDTSRIFFHGQSSGSGFLSDTFLPSHVNDYQGGALVLCGSGVPKFATPPTAAAKANFRLYYDITTNDGIWTSGWLPTIAAYKQAGLDIQSPDPNNLPPGGHCQFNQQAIVGQVIPLMISANAADAAPGATDFNGSGAQATAGGG